jgi:hypothetical protein
MPRTPGFRARRLAMPALLAGLLPLLAACGALPSTAVSLPESLGRLNLEHAITGDEASREIERLHARAVGPRRNAIGDYRGAAGNATLYVSRYDSASAARADGHRMAEGIERGNPVFAHYQVREMDGVRVSMCLGMGQAHFFFFRNAELYWLAADYGVAQETLEALVAAVR